MAAHKPMTSHTFSCSNYSQIMNSLKLQPIADDSYFNYFDIYIISTRIIMLTRNLIKNKCERKERIYKRFSCSSVIKNRCVSFAKQTQNVPAGEKFISIDVIFATKYRLFSFMCAERMVRWNVIYENSNLKTKTI